MRFFFNSCVFIFLIGLLGYMLPGCSTGHRAVKSPLSEAFKSLRAEASEDFNSSVLTSLAVLPLEDATSHNAGVGQSRKVLSESVLQSLTNSLVNALVMHGNLEVSNLSNLKITSQAEQNANSMLQSQQERANSFGKQLGVRGVIYGVVTRYEGEESPKLQAFSPSSAGFRLWLFDVSASKNVWSATFDRQEKPLSENLLQLSDSLNDGLGYKSRTDLIGRGFQQAAEALKKLK